MAHVAVHERGFELDRPTLIEGLPGVGMVGKIVVDHLVEELGMVHYGTIQCPGLPPVVTYEGGTRAVRQPVRIYADAERDLLAVQSDVPVSPTAVDDFASCLTGWLADLQTTGLYVSGTPADVEGRDDRTLSGVATEAADDVLDSHGIDPPTEDGIWRGPTGALLNEAVGSDLPALGVIVESDPNLPDPEAACTVLSDAIAPIVGFEVDVEELRAHGEEIRAAQEGIARQMGQDDESSRAEPLRMFW
jgi:uncharacterized protein